MNVAASSSSHNKGASSGNALHVPASSSSNSQGASSNNAPNVATSGSDKTKEQETQKQQVNPLNMSASSRSSSCNNLAASDMPLSAGWTWDYDVQTSSKGNALNASASSDGKAQGNETQKQP